MNNMMRFFLQVIVAAWIVVSPALADSAQKIRGPTDITLTAIPGAATDCSEYQYRLALSNDMTMSYVVTEPTDGSPPTLSAEIVHDGEAWISLGFSPDTRAKMIGSEAVIGLPLLPVSASNPGKYYLKKETNAGVYLRDSSEQTLMNGSVTQANGKTTMSFTKILQEPGEIGLTSQGQNVFLWAYGFLNELGLHDKKTGSGGFSLDITSPCIPTAVVATDAPVASTPAPVAPTPAPVVVDTSSSTTPAPVVPPTEAPVMTSTEAPVAAPVEAPTEAPVESDGGDDESEVEDGAEDGDEDPTVQDTNANPVGNGADCSQYQNSVIITDKLRMSYVVNVPTDGNVADGTVSIQLEYDGEAWISLGTAGSSKGHMIGSEAVIALPGKPVSQTNPGKYHMTAETNEGVFLMADESQSLMDGAIFQEQGLTILEFTKRLVEPNELSIAGDGSNTFLWAVGFNNDLNLHRASGAFRINLWPCGVPGGSESSVATQVGSQLSDSQKHTIWKSHAYMGLFAWGVFAPAAFCISFLRKLLKNQGALWFKLHMYMNILALILTLAAFSVAVWVFKDSDEKLFQDPHGIVGLVITILVSLQACNGIFRPPAPKQATASSAKRAAGDGSGELSHHGRTEEALDVDGAIEVGRTPDSSIHSSRNESDTHSSTTEKSQKLRTVWEFAHKGIGMSLIGMGLWQVNSGLDLYSTEFNTNDYSGIFWGVFSGVAGSVLGIKLVLVVRDRRR